MAIVPVNKVYISMYEASNEGGRKMERHISGPQGAKVVRKTPLPSSRDADACGSAGQAMRQ